MISAERMLQQLFEGFIPRQKEVLTGRFGLRGEAETLASLGKRYGVTRERVRQIEAGALYLLGKKIKSTPASDFLKQCEKYLKGAGGVAEEGALVGYADSLSSGITKNHMNLLIEAAKSFSYHPEDKEFRAFYYLDKNSLKHAQEFITQFVKALRGEKREILEGGFEVHLSKFARRERAETKLVKNYLSITKKIHTSAYGDTGLAEWAEIKPKTIRDRIYLVLKKKREPLHFESIAKHINEAGFNGRKALPPTVHNELIKDARFVLVGRGMYGLAEHGYEPGTAKEVIYKTLKHHGPLNFKELVATISKNRFFKPNTILANLQHKNLFERLDNGKYRVRES